MSEAIQEIYQGYIEAVCWLNDDEREVGMSDAELSDAELSDAAKKAIYKDCCAFFDKAWSLLYKDEYAFELEQAGYDFYLTRNGHGVGFWDRGLGQLGDQLTTIAKSFGQDEYYLSDDNQIERA